MAVSGGERRVALLRAINVGGGGRLKMADLRAIAVDELGFGNVETQGASGNLVYFSKATAEDDAQRLGEILGTRIQRPVVMVRTAAELRAVVEAEPFAATDSEVPDKWRFVVFHATPSKVALPDLPEDGELAYAARARREVCYTMSAPSARSLDMAKTLEKALGQPVTVRNWNVVRKLAEMANR